MDDTKTGTGANRRATTTDSQEWHKSTAAATLLYLPLAEFAAKFRAEHRDGSVLEREQARLLENLATYHKGLTGGAA